MKQPGNSEERTGACDPISEAEIDEALEESFPASDPLPLFVPGHLVQIVLILSSGVVREVLSRSCLNYLERNGSGSRERPTQSIKADSRGHTELLSKDTSQYPSR